MHSMLPPEPPVNLPLTYAFMVIWIFIYWTPARFNFHKCSENHPVGWERLTFAASIQHHFHFALPPELRTFNRFYQCINILLALGILLKSRWWRISAIIIMHPVSANGECGWWLDTNANSDYLSDKSIVTQITVVFRGFDPIIPRAEEKKCETHFYSHSSFIQFVTMLVSSTSILTSSPHIDPPPFPDEEEYACALKSSCPHAWNMMYDPGVEAPSCHTEQHSITVWCHPFRRFYSLPATAYYHNNT